MSAASEAKRNESAKLASEQTRLESHLQSLAAHLVVWQDQAEKYAALVRQAQADLADTRARLAEISSASAASEAPRSEGGLVSP